ncbi:MAG: DUF3021 family protein [Eubacterium sp.]|nr:DUF3021 family protein [Eubacterium sp.]
MMKEVLKKGAISFFISAFAGVIVNLIIYMAANAAGASDFCSISPEFRALFPTTAIAVYLNIILYGIIGATFAMMTVIYEFEKIGFIIQSVIYFVVTTSVCLAITMLLWQLHRYPQALIGTLLGYTATHVIMITLEYNKLKNDIKTINEEIGEE